VHNQKKLTKKRKTKKTDTRKKSG